jgi:hypothetical protein
MPTATAPPTPDRADLRARLLAAQFWVGIGLAPFAALLLIFGRTTAAAVLAIIAVVVLALSVIIRHGPSARPAELNVALVDEMDALRNDVRADITTAARATHRALSEKMTRLQESIAVMQRQVDDARAMAIEAREAADRHPELPLPPPRRPAAAVGSAPGVVRHTETVVTRSMYVDQASRDYGSNVYGPNVYGPNVYGPNVYGSSVYGSASVSAAARLGPDRSIVADRGIYGQGVDGVEAAAGTGRAEAERGRTGAERRGERAGARRDDDRYDRPEDGREAGAPRELTAEREESWTEQRLRAYVSGRDEPASNSVRDGKRDGKPDPGGSNGHLADDPRWSEMRDADRWAEVRADDHGRELRMAERREERRVDETGTQLRIVDRWSSVREERIGSATTHGRPAGETRAQRRRREAGEMERLDAEPVEAGRVEVGRGERPALPKPRRPLDDLDGGEWESGAGSGWRDVRSGVVEPDHSDEHRELAALPGRSDRRPAGTDRPAETGADWAMSRLREIQDGPIDSSSRTDPPRWAARDDDERRSDERRSDERRSDERRSDERRSDERRGVASWRDDRDYPSTARWDSGELRPDRRDSGELRPDRRDSGEVRPDRWDSGELRPDRRDSGHRPRMDFEIADDRWN